MQIRTGRARRLITALAATSALLGLPAAAPASPFENDTQGFLRDRTPLEQGARALAHEGFARKLICAEDCLVSGRVLVPPQQAQALGLAKPGGGKWVEIGRFANVRLEARTWKVVHVTLRKSAERALRRSAGSIRVYGDSVGVSLQSWRHGRAGWARTVGL